MVSIKRFSGVILERNYNVYRPLTVPEVQTQNAQSDAKCPSLKLGWMKDLQHVLTYTLPV
jgi:hypothetical protein